jgi:hypothetical protein
LAENRTWLRTQGEKIACKMKTNPRKKYTVCLSSSFVTEG